MEIKTVLGRIPAEELGVTLPHEHICCYFEYFYQSLQGGYLDKKKLADTAVIALERMKGTYGLNTIVDCTPVNIGRDLELLREVSRRSGVNIVCSTGFYYTEEIMLNGLPAEEIARFLIRDAEEVSNAGLIKLAIENGSLSPYEEKLFAAAAEAHKRLGLPICVHTNGKNENGRKVLEFLLSKGVPATAVTIAHLSDSDDVEYVKEIEKSGCFLGFDRIYNQGEDYMMKKAADICEVAQAGYADRILISHDELFFNGFLPSAGLREDCVYERIFSQLFPCLKKAGLSEKDIEQFSVQNPRNMLCLNGG